MRTTPAEEESDSDRTRAIGNIPSPHFSPWPHTHAFGEERAIDNGTRALRSAAPKMPSRSTAISLAIIDKYSFTCEAITRSLRAICKSLSIVPFITGNQLLESKRNYDAILYHEHDDIVKKDNTERFSDIKKLSTIAPVILLSDFDHFDLMCAAFDDGVRGYIPTTSTTLGVAIEIIYLVKAGGTFVPPSSLSPRRSKLPVTRRPIEAQKFTARQRAVLEHLKMGQTNKIIAFELNMSQSSVKTHIQNIMRKVNAANRTQVVYLVQELEMSGNQAMDLGPVIDLHES